MKRHRATGDQKLFQRETYHSLVGILRNCSNDRKNKSLFKSPLGFTLAISNRLAALTATLVRQLD